MTQSTYRPTPPRCPDCDRILGHDHRDDCKILAPCPDCGKLHIHAVGCPNPEILPCFGKWWTDRKPLPSDTEFIAWSRMNPAHLIAPHVPSLEPFAVLVRDEDIEGAR